jgi:putative membrane protein
MTDERNAVPPAAAEPARDAEPDYRFTLANERTFLAWIRTALALLAAGVAVEQLLPPFALGGGRKAMSAICLLLAVILAVGCFFRWRMVQAAMRRGDPLPRGRLVPVLTGGVVALVVVAVVVVAFR